VFELQRIAPEPSHLHELRFIQWTEGFGYCSQGYEEGPESAKGHCGKGKIVLLNEMQELGLRKIQIGFEKFCIHSHILHHAS